MSMVYCPFTGNKHMEGDKASCSSLARHQSVIGGTFRQKFLDRLADEAQLFLGQHAIHQTGDRVFDNPNARPDDIDGNSDSDQRIERGPAGNCH